MANELEVQGLNISYKKVNKEDYISLTDLARFRENEYPSDVIRNWMRTYRTIEYLGIWEQLYNPSFNSVEFHRIKNEAPENAFVMTPTRWVETTNAIGIVPSRGKYAVIFAHKDIAFKFASWISVEFELYLIKEFQRLKETEQKQLAWTAKRELAKMNYHIHTDAIKEYIVPALSQPQLNYVYASEADLLNVAMFGKTAAEWRKENTDKKGNIRDFATIEQLLVLANMESYNSVLIEQGKSQSERLQQLNSMAHSQMRVLSNYSSNLLNGKNDL